MHSERAPLFLKIAAWGGVIFLHFPLLIIAAYAFNTEDAAFSFPPKGLTLKWFSVAAGRGDIIDSVTLSLQIAALALHRHCPGAWHACCSGAVAKRVFWQECRLTFAAVADCPTGDHNRAGAADRLQNHQS